MANGEKKIRVALERENKKEPKIPKVSYLRSSEHIWATVIHFTEHTDLLLPWGYTLLSIHPLIYV